MRARFECVSGLLAGVAGAAGLAVFLLAPINGGSSFSASGICPVHGPCVQSTYEVTREAQSAVQAGLRPVAIVLLMFLALALLGIALGAYWHCRSGSHRGRGILVISTIALFAGAVASNYGGLFLLPALVLAAAAVAASSTSAPPDIALR